MVQKKAQKTGKTKNRGCKEDEDEKSQKSDL
jgi:hypothetical protein